MRATVLLILLQKDGYIFVCAVKNKCAGTKMCLLRDIPVLCRGAQSRTHQLSRAVLAHLRAPPGDLHYFCPSSRPSPTCLLAQKPSQMRDHALCRPSCSSHSTGPIPALSHPTWKEEQVQSAHAGDGKDSEKWNPVLQREQLFGHRAAHAYFCKCFGAVAKCYFEKGVNCIYVLNSADHF